MPRQTTVSIHANAFHVNNQPTYANRYFAGRKIEGLLLNARLVQGIFDDRNPATRHLWNYPDGLWDPDRNTAEFVAAMPLWRRSGLLGFTINLQGGSPQGYSKDQPWHNSAFDPDGALRPDYLVRLARILDAADALGMVPILGFFYFGQEHRFTGEPAILRAADAATDWLLAQRYTNVLVEIANECDIIYKHDIIKPPRAHELIRRVQQRSTGRVSSPLGRLLVSTSLCGGAIPTPNIVASADFLLLHGNGVNHPDGIRNMVDQTRAVPTYTGQPILFNEDDHFNFDHPDNNFLAATDRYAGWGYFDYRMTGEGFDQGYQSVPTNWTISSKRKQGFFDLLKQVTGAPG